MTEGSFSGVDGIKIFTREWQPAGEPHAVVVISHGFNAHSGQYEWASQQFVSNRLAVYALDHRGRGRSEGERFFVKKFADWTMDLATFMDMVKARGPGLPVFLFGHSACGVIACGYTLEHTRTRSRASSVRTSRTSCRRRTSHWRSSRLSATWRRTRTS